MQVAWLLREKTRFIISEELHGSTEEPKRVLSDPLQIQRRVTINDQT